MLSPKALHQRPEIGAFPFGNDPLKHRPCIGGVKVSCPHLRPEIRLRYVGPSVQMCEVSGFARTSKRTPNGSPCRRRVTGRRERNRLSAKCTT